MSVLNNTGILAGASGAVVDPGEPLEVENSVRFNSGDAAYLSETPSGAGNRRTFTHSFWIKRSALGSQKTIFSGNSASNFSNGWQICFENDDTLSVNGSSPTFNLTTSQVFRDTSAWYHIVVSTDTTQPTVKIYINGSQVTAFGTENYPSQDDDMHWNGAFLNRMSGLGYTSSVDFDGYLADVHFVDGTALDATSFGLTDGTTGQWVPKDCSGDLTYGTNGFYFKFDNASVLGEDSSGENNDWTPANLQSNSDVFADVPGTPYDNGSYGGGNYATLMGNLPYLPVMADGNLEVSETQGSAWKCAHSSMGMSTGKWYAEYTPINLSGTQMIGIIRLDDVVYTSNLPIVDKTWGFGYISAGIIRSAYNQVNETDASYGSTWQNGDVIGVAYDADTQALTYYKNGVSQGATSWTVAPSAGTYAFAISIIDNTAKGRWNFGGTAFAHTPPTGYKALNAYNSDAPTITDPSKHFDVATDTGANILSAATGLTDGADFVWIKDRANSSDHILFNRINDTGMDGTPHLRSNETDTEATCGTYSAPSGNSVGWAWNAGTTTDPSNNDGSIQSEVRANTTAGFSCVSYSGSGSTDTIGHGLSSPPQFIIAKNRENTFDWGVYHVSAGPTVYLKLNWGDSTSTQATWQNTAPTSSVFYVGNYNSVNQGPAEDYTAYCWTSVPGYSKFSRYEGNNSADGPFIALGFRPAMILIKNIDTNSTNWAIYDNKRDTFNGATKVLAADSSGGGNANDGWQSSNPVDFLSNGFKLRNTTGEVNGNYTYIYAAWAESPTKYSRAR